MDNCLMPSSVRNCSWLLAKRALILCGVLFALPSTGLCGTRTVPDDFLIKTWNTEDSLAGATVTAITQTPDGYLWVGTYEGLTRFDGVHSEVYDSQNRPALGHSRIQGLTG